MPGTVSNFHQQLTAGTDVADDDMLLMYDTSAGVPKSITPAVLRSEMGGVVVTTATLLSVTAASHAGKWVVINSASPIAITLPAATGTGNEYKFKFGVAATGTASTIAALTTDVIEGMVFILTTDTDTIVQGYATSATSDKISANGTTQGGRPGDVYIFVDTEAAVWQVNGWLAPTGAEATPFSAT